MSDQITEDYQEQVLVDLSEIKDSVTTDSGYEEKVLDDLDDIKESVSEEQEYYDKEYQKKVLGNLRNLQKSVEALNYVEVSPLEHNLESFVLNGAGNKYNGYNTYTYFFNVHNVSVFYIDIVESGASTNWTNSTYGRFTDVDYSTISSASDGTKINCSSVIDFGNSPVSKRKIVNSSYYDYFLIQCGPSDRDISMYVEKSSDSGGSGGDVTSGSAVMVDGIDTLIQISTFQGFASALLTGILLFLLFVKGLRR